MKAKELIKFLQRYNEDTEVCIFDIKKHEHHDFGDPHGTGIEPNFNAVLMRPKGSRRFIALEYMNYDYDEILNK